MKIGQFDYVLPQERIAKYPAPERQGSRLILMGQRSGLWQDSLFEELPHLLGGDELLVCNNVRVFPARLFGRRRGVRAEPPGRHGRRLYLTAPIEVLLVRRVEDPASPVWEALVRPGRKIRVGEVIEFGEGEFSAEVVARGSYGLRTLRFACQGDFQETVERLGHVPLPPYIDRAAEPDDRVRYQTVFASRGQAVAAPTAALHFTPAILQAVRDRGCTVAEITLEIGYGTFQPIHTETVEGHKIHPEPYEISPEAASAIEQARADGRPVLAVGTTVVRALEDCAARNDGRVVAGRAEANIYIYPGYQFRVVRQLLTNFHLPRSSLLILVCAFAGRENVLHAYRHAVEAEYRFYSYGDCMLIR